MIQAKGSDDKTRTYKGTTSLEVNQALSHGGEINLGKGEKYTILDSLLFPSDTHLIGNGATIKLAPKLPLWGSKGSIASEKAMLMILGNAGKNIAIEGLTVDGSQADYYPKVRLGAYYFNMATLIGVDGLKIHDCTFRNGCNDAMLLSGCKNVEIDSVLVDKCGHDGVYAHNVNNIKVIHSKFINRTNSSCRFDGVTNGIFEFNDCTTSGGGYAGLELENRVTNISCQNNFFHDMPWGIAKVHAVEKGVVIKDNKYKNVRNGVLG